LFRVKKHPNPGAPANAFEVEAETERERMVENPRLKIVKLVGKGMIGGTRPMILSERRAPRKRFRSGGSSPDQRGGRRGEKRKNGENRPDDMFRWEGHF
jgi:hypothetical protein